MLKKICSRPEVNIACHMELRSYITQIAFICQLATLSYNVCMKIKDVRNHEFAIERPAGAMYTTT